MLICTVNGQCVLLFEEKHKKLKRKLYLIYSGVIVPQYLFCTDQNVYMARRFEYYHVQKAGIKYLPQICIRIDID